MIDLVEPAHYTDEMLEAAQPGSVDEAHYFIVRNTRYALDLQMEELTGQRGLRAAWERLLNRLFRMTASRLFIVVRASWMPNAYRGRELIATVRRTGWFKFLRWLSPKRGTSPVAGSSPVGRAP